MTLPRESWIVLAAAGGGVAVVQTARLWWRAASLRWRLAEQSARATAGEALAEKLLARAGFAVEARQVTRRWAVHVDGEAHEVTLRADFVVRRRGRRYVAEVKTGETASTPRRAACTASTSRCRRRRRRCARSSSPSSPARSPAPRSLYQ